MADRCETAAVLGAGVMGSAIAAHLAGAGIRTHLLDIVPPNLSAAERSQPEARSRLAASAIDKALKAKPAPFYDPDAARLVVPGNLEDHLDRLRECDLVIEAVVERLDIKTALFARIAPYLPPHAIVASNTSGLSIQAMSDALPENVQPRFLVMHFFNPVRYMRLLEIVAAPKTEPAVIARAARLGEFLGKGVVYGKDTPNFVANRIGVYGMMLAMHLLEEGGYSIEEVDAIVGRPMGRPKSAAFRTGDIVGIDTLVHVAQNCYDRLPDDEEREVFRSPAWVIDLVEKGRLGQKSGAGFYKKVGNDIQVLDIKTGDYRPQVKPRFDSIGAVKGVDDLGERLKKLVSGNDRAAQFAWKALSRTLCYSARRVGEIAGDLVNIDRAMRWGFNWDMGPFAAWDVIGVAESVLRMQQDGLEVPAWVLQMLDSGRSSFFDGPAGERRCYDVTTQKPAPLPRDPHRIRLAALHASGDNIVRKNLGASLVDLGDGALCLEVHTKMNTIDGDVVDMMEAAVDEAERNFEAIVIANDGDHFGAGANVMLIYMAAQQKQWDAIETIVRRFQGACQKLRYANVPVVAAPFQMTLGGVTELAMAADACQAYAETYMGLVEVGVGLIPAGCGCLRMVERWSAPVASIPGADMLPAVGQAALNIAMAKVSTSAEEARRLRYLQAGDGISLNREHLLYHAKQRALGMARASYRKPRPPMLAAAGIDAAKTIAMQVWGMVESGFATPHDALIARKIAHVVCGGNVAAGTVLAEQAYLDLEIEAFLALCGEQKSQARMQSLLMTNKTVRN